MLNYQQVLQTVQKYLQKTGRGGFRTGVVTSVDPLKIRISDRLELPGSYFYITDNCLGLSVNLRHQHGEGSPSLQDQVMLRPSLKSGDAVLILCRPADKDGTKYILLDRIQPYMEKREVDAE